MREVIVLLAVGFVAVVVVPTEQSVIVGGSLAVISQYPSVAALLYSPKGITFSQACVGTIVTTNAILTAAHCVYGDANYQWRARLGSSWANSGGLVYIMISITVHPSFNIRTRDNDIAILRPVASIALSNSILPVSIAGTNYNLPDNQVVWAVGWGTSAGGAASTQFRHVQAWSINQYTCSSRYAVFGENVTENMFCFGWPNLGNRNQCQGDSGGPVFHNGTLVGVSSWGYGCANAVYPGVNVRVSRFATWIQSNA